MKKYKFYLMDSLMIFIGSAVLAVGINVFLAPNRISSGGLSGIGTVLMHLFGVKLSVTNLIGNILLFALGFRYLSRYAVVKTVEGILSLTLFLEITGYLPIFGEDIMVSVIVGGVLAGAGIGLVVRCTASTGGSDFAALIIRRFLPHISLANLILIIDCTIIVISGIIFRSFTLTVLSMIAMYICAKVTDSIVVVGDEAKTVQIFSSKHEEISAGIMENYDRGVTGYHCRGMYSGKEGIMLMCVVSPKEMPLVVSMIRRIDRDAFVVINDAKEVLGKGFKEKSSYDSL